jgi:hypothetical protein
MIARLPRSLALASLAGCVHLAAPRGGVAGGRDVSLRFEGTCALLACCSTHGIGVRAGTSGGFDCALDGGSCRKPGWFAPGFTCNPELPHRYRQPNDPPYLACADHELWISLPALTHAECGETYMVCYRGARVLAVARDRSAPNGSGKLHYEASLGLLRALGADPDARETIVSVYPLADMAHISGDPSCVGDGS